MEHIKIWGAGSPPNRLKAMAIGFGMAIFAVAATPLAVAVMPPLIAGLALSAALLGPLIAWAIHQLRPGHVHIGSDGLMVRRHDGDHYIPFDALREVTPYGGKLGPDQWVGAELRFHDDERLVILVGQDLPERRTRADHLVERLNAALATFERRATDGAQDVTALERGGRSPEQWLQSLRNVGEGGQTHREASMPVERLWEILENPHATSCARASAAAALRPRLDTDGERRIRVTLDDTAAPKLRVALESALRRDEEGLALALVELDRDGVEANEA